MLRSRRRHWSRGGAAAVTVAGDDLATWPLNGQLVTQTLPGTPPLVSVDPDTGQEVYTPQDTQPYFLLIDVTAQLPADAVAAVSSLRFTDGRGVRLGHLRTATNRILVGGVFLPGLPLTLKYYWGKSGQTQPGTGFPSSAQLVSGLRLLWLVENGVAVDYAPSPAPFSVIGAPTVGAGRIGQMMTFGDGNRLETMAAKLRSDARTQRHAMALIWMPEGDGNARTICWADWLANQRAYQLFNGLSGMELYIDDDGVSPFQAWRLSEVSANGWNFIGGSWVAGEAEAVVGMNARAERVGRAFPDGPVPGNLHNSTSPYCIGGTPVAGFYHAGGAEMLVEFFDRYSPEQFLAWQVAWKEPGQFFGVDRTPNPFSIPTLSSQERSTEVGFAAVQITGISDGTPISISGAGSPSYAISSASTVTGDVQAKGTAAGTINNGQWVRVWHTTSASYSASVTSTLTVGTASVNAVSSTKAEPGTGGGSGIPTGTATYTVASLSALQNVIDTQLQPGQIVEIANGSYGGTLYIRGKDWSGGAAAVIRAASRGYRGYLAAEGGLRVSGETAYTTGSHGAQFSGFRIENGTKNVVLDGLRFYGGERAVGSNDSFGFLYASSDVQFHYVIFCGWKPPGGPADWGPTGYNDTNGWHKAGHGIVVGGGGLDPLRPVFKKCLWMYTNRGLFSNGSTNALYEDCMFLRHGADAVRNDWTNPGMTFRRVIWCSLNPQYGSNGLLAHPDFVQSYNGSTNIAARDHVYEYCIQTLGSSQQAEAQGVFLEADGYPNGTAVTGCTVRHSLMFSTTQNTIRMERSKQCTIENNTLLGDYYTPKGQGIATPLIMTDPWDLQNQYAELGYNSVRRNVAPGFDTGAKDTVADNISLGGGSYASTLVDYAQTGSSFVPLVNENFGTLDTAALARLGPKTSASFHPNNNDRGAWRLFQHFGVLA